MFALVIVAALIIMASCFIEMQKIFWNNRLMNEESLHLYIALCAQLAV